jgi:cobalt-precorrin-5B (C1)-methyltransferase
MVNADIKQPMQPAILIIGGTTEGRIAVEVCDEAGNPIFILPKNASQQIDCAHGKRISGGLDEESMPVSAFATTSALL